MSLLVTEHDSVFIRSRVGGGVHAGMSAHNTGPGAPFALWFSRDLKNYSFHTVLLDDTRPVVGRAGAVLYLSGAAIRLVTL